MVGIEAQGELLLLVLFASVLGGIIGYEREIDGHSAGFRTHIFICATAAALIAVGSAFLATFSDISGARIQTDPFRIIEAIIVGVSFVGGGVILKDEKEKRVKNLTTAASLLFTTVIGICVGTKFFFLALGLTALALVINYALLQVQKKLHEKEEHHGFGFHRD